MQKTGIREQGSGLIVLMLAIAASVGVAQQPAQKPAAAAKPETVTPKQPYDSRDAQLATEKEKNFRLQYSELQRNVQDRIEQLPQVVQLRAAEQQAVTDLNNQFNKTEAAEQAWETGVRKTNGWDASYVYDRAKDAWTHTEAAAKTAPEKK